MNSFVTAAASSLLDAVMLVCALHWTATSRLLLTEQPKMPAFCSPSHPLQCAAWLGLSSNCGSWLSLSFCGDVKCDQKCMSVWRPVCVLGGGGEGGSEVEAEAAFNKLEIHFHALVSLLFRVNNCPCFGSILQTEPQCDRGISLTCFFVLQHFN